MKHGGASRVSIDLREEQVAPNGTGAPVGKLRLRVHDNGRGFAADASMGMGMTAMRERVRGIGGSSAIDSARGHGTTLTVYVPLRAKTVTVKEVEGAI
jgi:signal transduction histidine kinase